MNNIPEHIVKSLHIYRQEFICISDVNNKFLNGLSLEELQCVYRLWGGSEYAARLCISNHDLFILLFQDDFFNTKLKKEHFKSDIKTHLELVITETDLMIALRNFRNKHQLRILWRFLNDLDSLEQTMTDLSSLATVCIDSACTWLYKLVCQNLGTPYNEPDSNGKRTQQKMIVLAMGKLGSGELNLSSDVDLIFCYPEQGITIGEQKSVSTQEFFIRLGQHLISVLETPTKDGFVMRVDMRLRPYGDSGSLVLSFAAMAQYYKEQGRDWERFAMTKVSVISGPVNKGKELLSRIKSFVYRRYLDFGVVESLRNIKQLLYKEVQRHDSNNIKLGSGGIREIEFIVQSFQIIHGGLEHSLQHQSTLSLLILLEKLNHLTHKVCKELKEAYCFLRNTEHALQAAFDLQTHNLPKTKNEYRRLAWVMGFKNCTKFSQKLNHHRQKVSCHFDRIISESDEQLHVTAKAASHWDSLWFAMTTEDEDVKSLKNFGFENPKEARKILVAFRDSKSSSMTCSKSADRIKRFMPVFIDTVCRCNCPDLALKYALPVIESVLKKTAYLVLLLENLNALTHLVKLCAANLWISRHVSAYPVLIDEFLNLGNLYSPPEPKALQNELRQQLLSIPDDDLEAQMETLRYFKISHTLRVVAAEEAGTLPLMKASDYFTWIAEAVLNYVLDIAWKPLIVRYGYPMETPDKRCDPGFIIIGYGKLGGIELGPSSDLDLVFIHTGDINLSTDGNHPIDNSYFFIRLAQRILHILATTTISGRLYNTDIRLRPSGNSGMLVYSMKGFKNYQKNEAWTWEHQALVRARVVAGSKKLEDSFKQIRYEVLSKLRDESILRQEIIGMRQKMRSLLGTKSTHGGILNSTWTKNNLFHIKHDIGGIVDIEFITQYAVLRWGSKYPVLLKWCDNIRILEEMGNVNIISVNTCRQIGNIYQTFRRILHHKDLKYEAHTTTSDLLHGERMVVIKLWENLLGVELLM